ncbi:MAG: ThiF family adenylyltransferase [Clostridia bacterium]|nr:ThiF family adenylyltransferase [Clostridia bacterium]
MLNSSGIHINSLNYLIIIVGVGGTGGNFAKELCRLVSNFPKNKDIKIVFMDGDTVELKNKSRQPFVNLDITRNKANILAERCSTTFDIDIIENTFFLTQKEQLLDIIHNYQDYLPIIIGCVDNHRARQIMHDVFNRINNCIYLDSANESWYGEVVCGLRGNGETILQPRAYFFPEVLTDSKIGKDEESCEVRIDKAPQHLVTNLQAAVILLSFISDILIREKVTCNMVTFDISKKFVKAADLDFSNIGENKNV